MPEVDIPQATSNCEPETASLALSSMFFLSTLLLVFFQILQPELGSYINYNPEFQPEINLFWKLNLYLRSKLKVAFLVLKTKKDVVQKLSQKKVQLVKILQDLNMKPVRYPKLQQKMVEQVELIGVEELTKLIEIEELTKLIGVEKLIRLLDTEELAKLIELVGLEELQKKETDLLLIIKLESRKLEQLRLKPWELLKLQVKEGKLTKNMVKSLNKIKS